MSRRAAAPAPDPPSQSGDAAGPALLAAPPPAEGPRRPPLPSRRRRRVRRATAILAAAAVLAVALALWLAGRDRAAPWTPGEELAEVTDRLARPAAAGAPEPAFADVTAAAGLAGFDAFAGERRSQLPEDMGPGAAWGDYDGDGDEDLFLVSAGGALSLPAERREPSRLYENTGGGFRLAPGFPETRVIGMGAAWGDADGDGDLDLALSGYEALLLYRNQGEGRFARDERFPSPAGFWSGLAWADFDRDGDLDLYVCGYVRYQPPAAGAAAPGATEQYGAQVPYTLNPASFEPERNLLLENRGDGTFEEVAAPWGVANPEGRSLGALWHDFDDDGLLDLYVANDISDNALFLNRGDTFEDAALAAWVADYRGAMGLAAGDYDRDGDDDLFVTHWLAQENALYQSRLRQAVPAPDERLLRPRAGANAPGARLSFTDVAVRVGVGAIALPMVGWGTEFADFDGDGWLDLVVANGSTVESKADPRRLEPQVPFLLWNRAGESFHDLAPRLPALAEPRVGRGLAVADYDDDGDLDLLLAHHDGGVRLLRNDMQRGRWLQLRLRERLAGGGLGRGEGAAVVAWVGGVPLRRAATGVSYLSQSSRTLHFGLGAAAGAERLEVRWPDGSVQELGPLAAGARWELVQGEREARRLPMAVPAPAAPPGAAPSARTAAAPDRARVVAFWREQRAGMDALKRRGDLDAAIRHFAAALALDPRHEDSRYYLATCLWARGERAAARAELERLAAVNAMSQRAFRQWAVYRAMDAAGPSELAAARIAAERAVAINGEETGSLMLLGELALLQGQPAEAARHLEHACRTNPRAVGGFFLRAYLAWRQGDAAGAREMLAAARAALGPDWKPRGAVAEGDVRVRQHREETPLSRFWEAWDGEAGSPSETFAPLAAHLAARGAGAP